MNRRYTADEYAALVKRIRSIFPDCGITADVMAGFPGETEGDFEDSLDMIERVKFCKVHAFKYSKRQGTAAAQMKDQVPGEVKNIRSQRLISAGEKAAAEFMENCRDAVRPVLFEERCTNDGLITGYSDNYIKVYAEGESENLNCIKKVKLLEKYKDGMKGEIV